MLQNNLSQLSSNRFFRFLLSGGINTVATYLLYLLLASVMHYQAAYLIAYTSGIALAYMLNLRLVFNAQSSLGKVVRYPLIYLIQYFLGAGLLYLLVSVLSLPNALAPLIVIILLLPISYYMNKKVLGSINNQPL
jgi:putative flippase GtrA